MNKYYKILGLELGANFQEVTNKYNELSKEFDPSNQADDLKDFFISEQKKLDDAFEKISSSISIDNSSSDQINDEIINKDLSSEEKVNDNHDSDFSNQENSFLDESNPSIGAPKKSKQILVNNALLIVIAVGIWGLFMQNMGLFVPSDDFTQKVRVVNTVDAEIQNSVTVNGSVDVQNTVDIDIKAINGHYNAFYGKKSTNGPYYGIPVQTSW